MPDLNSLEILLSESRGWHEPQALRCGDAVSVAGLPRAYSFAVAPSPAPQQIQFNVSQCTQGAFAAGIRVSILSSRDLELAAIDVDCSTATAAVLAFEVPPQGAAYTMLINAAGDSYSAGDLSPLEPPARVFGCSVDGLEVPPGSTFGTGEFVSGYCRWLLSCRVDQQARIVFRDVELGSNS
eukprot:COSAG06_NODE_14272_length_1171_cov_1.455732_3_plen_181_part_01